MAGLPPTLQTALHDRYRLERELGQGGMATVYLAHDLRHDRSVAIKVVHPELAAILGAERFLAEIKVTASLQHPHILPLLDSGQAGSQLFYVMPFVEGESLRQRLQREHQLPVDDAVRLAREVASALDFAHRRGIVHRDVKPENVLIQDGQALVADFGIAIAVNNASGSRLTQTGLSLGTPSYMSPEQAMGEREITPKSDVYSLGAMLYEMLAGEPPFTGPSPQAVVARVITEPAPPLERRRDTVPPHVAGAVRTALAKLPADRFASAAAFAEALERTGYFPTLPMQAAPMGGRFAGHGRWHAAAITAGIAVGCFVLGGFATSGWRSGRAAPTEVRWQRLVLSPNGPDAEESAWCGAALAPDDGSIVFCDTTGGTPQLWRKTWDRLQVSPISGTAGASAPIFSPDGAWIGFMADGKLKKVAAQGGAAVSLADSGNGTYPSIAWLDDGSLVYNTTGWSLARVSANGGPATTLVRQGEIGRAVHGLRPLPKGHGVLFTACGFACGTMEVWVYDSRRGKARRLLQDAGAANYVPPGHLVYLNRAGELLLAPFDLERLAITGAAVTLLDGIRTDDAGGNLRISPSGTALIKLGTNGAVRPAEALWVSRDGAITPVDSAWRPFFDVAGGMALSPDGSRLAVRVQESPKGPADLWLKPLGRAPASKLTFSGAVGGRPSWSTDGAEVRFLSADSMTRVLTVRADGTGQPRLLVRHPRGVYEMEPTPDGKALLVRVGSIPSGEIMLARLSDTTVQPLLPSGANQRAPTISPDGRWLAYVSDESGRGEIFVRPFPNVTDGRWQVSREGGIEPRWAHSGRELYYRAPGRAGPGSMMAAELLTAPTFTVTGVQRLFTDSFLSDASHSLYAVARDDRRFLLWHRVGRGNDTPSSLVLAEHWLGPAIREATRR